MPKINVKDLTRKQLESFYTTVHDTLGEAVHTGFRKGVDGGGSAEIWQAISQMPEKKYGDFVSWVLWSFRYSSGVEK